ncbi:hypothetical protein [Prosthecobacter dejongeii]|uniref:Uncharacterized protein n=1 Tax=Prosthecobacter dejongeii TaxID=48465 RepID=A0A7W7YIH9_9BACT|nr:hypothetical protein [Prosthecobacter dejongeii]MBB5036744.1 hypothetical protein [Prosthecobacter dejongeii]
MWQDIGLADWLADLDNCNGPGDRQRSPAPKAKAAQAHAFVPKRQRETKAILRKAATKSA